MAAKRFKSEGPVDYPAYRFGYCEWLQLDADEDPGTAYKAGFLPFSAEPGDPRHLFYMARSLRVDLAELHFDKKRRHDQRAWRAFELRRRLVDKTAFREEWGPHAFEAAENWMVTRFGEAYLSPERLDYVLRKPWLTDVLEWTHGDQLAAFALIARGSWGAHYWFVFYHNGDSGPHPPGHGYLVDFLEWAREEGLSHAYLGTAYGQKSLYKSRGIAGVEFWDGNGWCADKDRLRLLQEQDQPSGAFSSDTSA